MIRDIGNAHDALGMQVISITKEWDTREALSSQQVNMLPRSISPILIGMGQVAIEEIR